MTLSPKHERRRTFLRTAAAGVLFAMGGCTFRTATDAETEAARAEVLPDGRPRLPPGQRLINYLKPMGGVAGDSSTSAFRLRVHGRVRKELELDYRELLALPRTTLELDVHCVTGWSLLGREWSGFPVAELAEMAGVKSGVKHVIFEAAHGYTANVLLAEAVAPNSLVAYRHEGEPLAEPHGAPVRGLIPELYFWKSAKWLEGIRFQDEDEPGYWEVRGYNNHADPWKEERYWDG